MMNKIISLILVCFCITAFSQEIPPYSYNRIIVNIKSDQDINGHEVVLNQRFGIPKLDNLCQLEKMAEIRLLGNREIARSFTIQFSDHKDIPALVQRFHNLNVFNYVEPDYTGMGGGKRMDVDFFPNDNFWARQWALYNDGSFNLSPAVMDADIDMELAWDLEKGSDQIIVAILDSGLRLNHPEMNGRLWTNTIDTLDGIDNDFNGYVDDIHGYNFAYENHNPVDDHGHGTNVTGIVAAKGNNLFGYAGVDWHCKVLTCKILNGQNWGYYSWWVDAIYYAVNQGANVLNMSVGGEAPSSEFESAIDFAHDHGAIIVACMMNFNNNTPYYPAYYSTTIAVGSTDANDQRSNPFFWGSSSGSNFGDHIDICAPGNYIYGLDDNSNTNMSLYWGGTSQATPHVTGVVSLLLAQDPNRTLFDIRQILHSSSEDQVGPINEDKPGFDAYHGYGRLNAYNALNLGQTDIKSKDALEDSFDVSPNPVLKRTGTVHISNLPLNNNLISFWSIDGKLILQEKVKISERNVSIKLQPSISPGTYLIKIGENSKVLIVE